MKKFKALILSLVLIIIFPLCGCGQTVINNESDEIKLYLWEYIGKQGLVSTLKFEDDTASLTIKNDSKHCEIKGLCIFGENSFVIVDNNLKKEFLFGYTLSGTELELKYNGDTIDFEKVRQSE